jgi:hypothetical protein
VDPELLPTGSCPGSLKKKDLKGLSYELDFKIGDKNEQILALIRAAAGF